MHLPLGSTLPIIKESKIKQKFLTLFVNKINKKFISNLKELFNYWNKESARDHKHIEQLATESHINLGLLKLNSSKKWSLNRLKILQTQPLSKLNKLVSMCEARALVKMESLRKEFFAFGSISKAQSFAYYQILNFLKHLKQLIYKIQREEKLNNFLKKSLKTPKHHRLAYPSETRYKKSYPQGYKPKGMDSFRHSNNIGTYLIKEDDKAMYQAKNKIFLKKLSNIDEECRKIKLIEYLKDKVQKHRTENIFYYLPTISEVRKDMKKIQKFTKQNANFLFAINNIDAEGSLTTNQKEPLSPHGTTNILSGQRPNIKEKIKNVLSFTSPSFSKKNDQASIINNGSRDGLQNLLLEQIEKQRNLCNDILTLTPKISIKFFSVKSVDLQNKASYVAESITDALEKRKAFRKVIKDAKENLMKTSSVKGVKIQVAGRLNGAEIARSEWVRAGRVPLQTLRANIDYSYRTASTIYGIIGVKVWIFKGYSQLIN